MARTLRPGSRISHYRIVGPLGAGGTGEDYRTQDPELDRGAALKTLPPELVRREDGGADAGIGGEPLHHTAMELVEFRFTADESAVAFVHGVPPTDVALIREASE